MKKKTPNMKLQWTKFIIVMVLYLLFLLWLKSWLGLDVGRNPICHSSCGAIGKREAEHIIIMHAVFIMRDAYSLCENLRLSASRRGKHEVVSTFYIYNILLFQCINT